MHVEEPSILIPALAAAFAAFCVWLTVRIVNRRERWAKWTLAATLNVPVLYVLSFGPICWITSRNKSRAPDLYMPIGWLFIEGPPFVSEMIECYAQIGMAPDTIAWFLCDDVHLAYVNSPDLE